MESKNEEDLWISTLCESQCADAPCLLKVRRVNGVAMNIEPNTGIEDFEKLTKNQGDSAPNPTGFYKSFTIRIALKVP